MDTLDRKKGARCRDGEAPTIHELSEKRMTSAKRPPKNPRLLRTPELPTGCLQPPLMALPCSHSARSSARQSPLSSHPYLRWHFMKLLLLRASLVAQLVKTLPATWETQVQSLSQEEPLEEGTATHSSILAWRIPRGCKESDTTERLSIHVTSC